MTSHDIRQHFDMKWASWPHDLGDAWWHKIWGCSVVPWLGGSLVAPWTWGMLSVAMTWWCLVAQWLGGCLVVQWFRGCLMAPWFLGCLLSHEWGGALRRHDFPSVLICSMCLAEPMCCCTLKASTATVWNTHQTTTIQTMSGRSNLQALRYHQHSDSSNRDRQREQQWQLSANCSP